MGRVGGVTYGVIVDGLPIFHVTRQTSMGRMGGVTYGVIVDGVMVMIGIGIVLICLLYTSDAADE